MAHGYRASWIANHAGVDYWSKRLGNKCNGPGRHKSGKIKTKRMERQAERRLIYDEYQRAVSV